MTLVEKNDFTCTLAVKEMDVDGWCSLVLINCS